MVPLYVIHTEMCVNRCDRNRNIYNTIQLMNTHSDVLYLDRKQEKIKRNDDRNL